MFLAANTLIGPSNCDFCLASNDDTSFFWLTLINSHYDVISMIYRQ